MTRILLSFPQAGQVTLSDADSPAGHVALSFPQVSGLVLSAVGVQGPAGLGSAVVTTFTQPTPSSFWTVNHALGYFPIVRLKTLGTAEIEGEINHVSENQFTVTLNSPMAGQALYI